MDSKVEYRFRTSIWRHEGGWYFASLPPELSAEIRSHLGYLEEDWGRLKAVATVAGVEWSTAIWFDTKSTHALYLTSKIQSTLLQMLVSVFRILPYLHNTETRLLRAFAFTINENHRPNAGVPDVVCGDNLNHLASSSSLLRRHDGGWRAIF